MPINQTSFVTKDFVYFISPTIKNWYYIFDRHNRWQILADSLIYFQKNKGLEIFGYVFMLNHIHMIVKSPNIIAFLRDFKKFTSKKMLENIAKYEPDVLDLFRNEDGGYNFWKKDNQPKIIENEKFGLQKLNYIHNNPVVKGYVDDASYWKYSSANPDSIIKIVKW